MSSFSSGCARAVLIGVLVTRHAAAEACAPGPAETPRVRAKAEYGLGLTAFEQKSYREAIDHLTCANQLVPSAELAYNIAVTYDAMEDAASALRWYREYRRQGGADADSEPVQVKVAELEAELQARGVQQVTIVSTPPGATLRIDEQAMGLTPFTLELKPGRHRYQLAAPERATVDATFELRPDRSLDVVVELGPAQAPTPAADGAAAVVLIPAAPRAPASEPGLVEGIGTWTWVSLGAGALLLGGAAGVELKRRQIEDELHDVSQVRFQERYDSMSAHQTTARVLFGLGAAALTLGGVLFVLDSNRHGATHDVALGSCAEGGLCLATSGVF